MPSPHAQLILKFSPLAHSTSGKQIMTSFPLVIFFHQNLIDKNHKTC